MTSADAQEPEHAVATGDVAAGPEELRRAVEAADVTGVVAWVRRTGEKQRRAAFAELAAAARQPAEDWQTSQRRAPARIVALVGCASTAKKAVTALNRGQLRWGCARRSPPRCWRCCACGRCRGSASSRS
ncbi:hypothetical protein ACFQZ4_17885 [Catellatospora coxensis]